MHAASFLGAVAAVRGVVSHSRAERALSADESSPAVDAAHDATCDLVDLCVAGTPLPPLDWRPTEESDATVASVLDAKLDELTENWTPIRCDGGRPPEDDDSPVDAPSSSAEREDHTVTSYAAAERVRDVDGRAVVPLARTGPAAANWYVLYDVLASAVASVAADCRTLVDRHQLQGNSDAAETWDGVADLLSAVASFADYHVAVARWVRVPGKETVEQATQTRTLAERLGTDISRKQ